MILCTLAALAAAGADRAIAQAPAHDAAFVAQTVPGFIELRTPTPVSITMRNTGTATWRVADGDIFLSSQEPQDNYYWCIQDNAYGGRSGNRVLLPHDVAPGEDVVFDFVVSPLSCVFTATPPFRFRMLSPVYGTFGEMTPDPQIAVSTANTFVSQQVPTPVPTEATFQSTVTFKNTTNFTWLATDGYSLAPVGATTWGVTSVALAVDVAPSQNATFAIPTVAPKTAGKYNFQWQMKSPAGAAFGVTSPATNIDVLAGATPDFSGLWWNAPAGSEAGWGLNVAQQGDIMFVTWFTYDATGKGLWLSMTATQTLVAGQFSGNLVQSNGPPFNAVPFRPGSVASVFVGVATLTFTDSSTATFDYTLYTTPQKKTLTRQVFGPLPTCVFNFVPDPSTATNYQDLWWASPAGSEAGWGMNLTQQGDTIFLTWFTYDLDGTPMWLSATAPKTDAAKYEGTLYRTTGPAFSAVPFDPSKVTATAVGAASLVFQNGNLGTFAYTVNGVQQSKSITRQIFNPPGTVCL